MINITLSGTIVTISSLIPRQVLSTVMRCQTLHYNCKRKELVISIESEDRIDRSVGQSPDIDFANTISERNG